MKKYNIAFVCVHNSCRSQMAEAITKEIASDMFNAYSAGTETKPNINQDAVAVIQKQFGVNMNETQYSKLLTELPNNIDVLITMGCNVECPTFPCKFREDWGLEDPTGKNEEAFIYTANTIQEKLLNLRKRIELNEIKNL